MIHIRKLLAREGQIVLAELGAPDFATLLRRVTFWVRFYIVCGIILGGIVAVGEVFAWRRCGSRCPESISFTSGY
jgi:hypothetical protein